MKELTGGRTGDRHPHGPPPTDRAGWLTYDDLFDADTHPVSEVLRRSGEALPAGNTRVPAAVYHSREFHDLEIEHL